MAAAAIPLAGLSGYGEFLGEVVDTMFLAFVTNGLLICGITWIATATTGRAAWAARILGLANGGIALLLAVVFSWAVLHPPVL